VEDKRLATLFAIPSIVPWCHGIMSSMKKEMSVMKPSAQKGRRGRIDVMTKKKFVKVDKSCRSRKE
jgi:hypothetical protein